jgi:hypothetical protein
MFLLAPLVAILLSAAPAPAPADKPADKPATDKPADKGAAPPAAKEAPPPAAKEAKPAPTSYPPFPPPKLAQMTDQLKCDWGTVVAVDASVGQLRINAAAGLVVFKAPAETQLIGIDGKPAGSVGGLKPGQKVRVYYTVNYVANDGAKVSEVDLEP